MGLHHLNDWCKKTIRHSVTWLIRDESCPREAFNGPLRVTDSRTETDCGCAGAD
jgi:hypothetical protein